MGDEKKEKEMRLGVGVFRWMRGGGLMDKNGFARQFFWQLMDEVAACLKTRAV